MASKVFAIDAEGGLRPLEHSAFPTEKQLDKYIENYPELLASALGSDEESLRFILVQTQAGIDDADSGAARWAADALFLDQKGVLTIVENKLAKNPEIRRKVVGQMIEYAANLLQTLNADGLLQRLQNTDDDADSTLAELLQLPNDAGTNEEAVSEFWTHVQRNLQAGMIRMVFAADRIPSELRQVIEFLNRHMSPMEVLGVSVDCMRDPTIAGGQEILVTSTIGVSTGKKAQRTTPGKNEPISKEGFLQFCANLADDSSVGKVAKRLVAKLAQCEALESRCHRTPGGYTMCSVLRKAGGEPVLKIAVRPTNELRFSLGKLHKLKKTVERFAKYDLPIQGRVDEWCASSEANEQRFIQWIIDAATR